MMQLCVAKPRVPQAGAVVLVHGDTGRLATHTAPPFPLLDATGTGHADPVWEAAAALAAIGRHVGVVHTGIGSDPAGLRRLTAHAPAVSVLLVPTLPQLAALPTDAALRELLRLGAALAPVPATTNRRQHPPAAMSISEQALRSHLDALAARITNTAAQRRQLQEVGHLLRAAWGLAAAKTPSTAVPLAARAGYDHALVTARPDRVGRALAALAAAAAKTKTQGPGAAGAAPPRVAVPACLERAYCGDCVHRLARQLTTAAHGSAALRGTNLEVTCGEAVNTGDYTYAWQALPAGATSAVVRVQAVADAHIALSPAVGTGAPQPGDALYEITLGGLADTRSVVRRQMGGPNLADAYTPGVVTGDEPREFFVSWADGVVTVQQGVDGTGPVVVQYADPTPLPAPQRIGVATELGSTGQWQLCVEGGLAPIDDSAAPPPDNSTFDLADWPAGQPLADGTRVAIRLRSLGTAYDGGAVDWPSFLGLANDGVTVDARAEWTQCTARNVFQAYCFDGQAFDTPWFILQAPNGKFVTTALSGRLEAIETSADRAQAFARTADHLALAPFAWGDRQAALTAYQQGDGGAVWGTTCLSAYHVEADAPRNVQQWWGGPPPDFGCAPSGLVDFFVLA